MAREPKLIRVEVKDPLLSQWEAVLESHNISQQSAVTAFLEWLVVQDDLTRAMLFKQVAEKSHGELTRIVLRRLAGDGKGKR